MRSVVAQEHEEGPIGSVAVELVQPGEVGGYEATEFGIVLANQCEVVRGTGLLRRGGLRVALRGWREGQGAAVCDVC